MLVCCATLLAACTAGPPAPAAPPPVGTPPVSQPIAAAAETTAPSTIPPPTAAPSTAAPPTAGLPTAGPPTAGQPTVAPPPIGPVGALGRSWHAGCPVPPSGLRRVTVRYVGFDGAEHTGELVVAATVAPEVAAIFADLLRQRFPVRQIRPVDAYGASDDASMAADNTSAFNCRPVTGGTAWSPHAYGTAIDLNPRENPYVRGTTTLPPGATYDPHTRGTVTPTVVAIFARHGWTWGGHWTTPLDYQHFEKR
jgi:D-alanyl-D-alanine carboxypeptidase-like protein